MNFDELMPSEEPKKAHAALHTKVTEKKQMLKFTADQFYKIKRR